jgi:hypothetical protein
MVEVRIGAAIRWEMELREARSVGRKHDLAGRYALHRGSDVFAGSLLYISGEN